jgi:hypothetical protein
MNSASSPLAAPNVIVQQDWYKRVVNERETFRFVIMRIFLFAIAAMCIGSIYAQIPVRDTDGKYTYKGIDTIADAEMHELYQRAVKWCESEFKTSDLKQNNGIDKISHSGNFPVYWWYKKYKSELQVSYILSIECRDSRYKYEFTDFVVSEGNGANARSETLEMYCDRKQSVNQKGREKVIADILSQIDAQITEQIADLAATMSGNNSEEKW